ncbi:MAG: heavy metal-binding domain-containing protein, partial [Gaiellaceae bacterium]
MTNPVEGSNEPAIKDPVCGMTVDPATARGGSAVHVGRTYYFCNPRCREKFRAEPERYLTAQPTVTSQAGAAAATTYTCPMQPEIVRNAPGSCPLCGMALEPVTVTADEEANPELIDMTRRFWISAPLAAVVLIISMSEMIPGEPLQHALGSGRLTWAQFVLATPVVLWGGWPFFQRGWASVVNRSLN